MGGPWKKFLGGGGQSKKNIILIFWLPLVGIPFSFGNQSSDPTNPIDPADLADPTDPADPAEPTDPADPAGKKEPTATVI